MKKLLTILLSLPLLVGCKDETTLLSERDKIEKYLTSSRGMVAEVDIPNVIEEEPAFYSVFGRYAYRHIVNYYDAERENRAIVERGDRVEIRFNAYTFSGSEPSAANIYLSNIPATIEALDKHNTGTLDWPTEPEVIILGTTETLEGIERTLPGCREADSVQIYMTSSLAYDKKLVGIVPKHSMVAWYLKIEKVTK